MVFLSSIKLQYSRTIVNLFFKSDDGHAISRQEKRGLPKSTARFPAKKRWHSLPPVGLTWHSPPPPRVLRTDGRTDVRLAYGACARSASGSENRVFLRHYPSS